MGGQVNLAQAGQQSTQRTGLVHQGLVLGQDQYRQADLQFPLGQTRRDVAQQLAGPADEAGHVTRAAGLAHHPLQVPFVQAGAVVVDSSLTSGDSERGGSAAHLAERNMSEYPVGVPLPRRRRAEAARRGDGQEVVVGLAQSGDVHAEPPRGHGSRYPAAGVRSAAPAARSASTRSRATSRDEAHIWSRNSRSPASPSGRARYRRRVATFRSVSRPAFLSTVRCWLTAVLVTSKQPAISPAASSVWATSRRMARRRGSASARSASSMSCSRLSMCTRPLTLAAAYFLRQAVDSYGISPNTVAGEPEPARILSPPMMIQPPVGGIWFSPHRFSRCRRWSRRSNWLAAKEASAPGSIPIVSIPRTPMERCSISQRAASAPKPG